NAKMESATTATAAAPVEPSPGGHRQALLAATPRAREHEQVGQRGQFLLNALRQPRWPAMRGASGASSPVSGLRRTGCWRRHPTARQRPIANAKMESATTATETTINNSYDIGRRLCNLPRLRAIGFAANRRLLDVERLSHDCVLAETTFQAI